MQVKIIDAICGSGKTSAAINMINNSDENTRFMYITPYLSEVERIISNCPSKNFVQPEKTPTKLANVKSLIIKGKNIVSTHALFQDFDDVVCEFLKISNYTLILDEVCDVIEQFDIGKLDLQTMLRDYAKVLPNKLIQWTKPEYNEEKYRREKWLCEKGALAVYRDIALLWLFPVKIFTSFTDVYVLTYMFDGQVQKYYYDFNNIQYQYLYVTGNTLDSYTFTTEKQIEHHNLASKVHILNDDVLNYIGRNETALSKSWYTRAKKNGSLPVLKKNIYNFFKLRVKSPSKLNMWTTFKEFRTALKGEPYTKGFVACNARATNEFREKTSLAYLINRYMNPIVKEFFSVNNIPVDEDKYALSELIQWMFRSGLRDKKDIDIYVPSRRMRELLENWLKEA